MKDNALLNAPIDGQVAADDLLKTTALLYLKEALYAERFEECASLIQSAKSFGASVSEVSKVLDGYIRALKAGPNGANSRKARLFT